MSLVVALFLLAGNAFFVGAEFAMLTARRDRMEALAADGVARARVVLRAGRELPLLIAGAQLGITVCSLGLGALGEPAIAHLIEGPLEPLGLPVPLLHAIAFTIALAIVVFLHTVLGEMVPKNLAIAGPEPSALWLVPVHYAFCRLLRPALGLFTLFAHWLLRRFGVEPKDELENAYTSEELSDLLGESRREGLLEDSEHRRLNRTLSSAERTVAEVLVPVERLTTVPEAPTVGDIRDAVARTGFSRFPLRAADGRLVGYLHVKDVLDLAGADRDTPVPRARFRGLPEIPADARLDDALAALRRAQSHVARAVGTTGITLGVVALEDLVEEYVGTVRDATHITRR
ncbi:MAG TPA: hemolysin family protein [Pseudonocardiaceae bacterium]